MASVSHLAHLIASRRGFYAKQMASELARMRAEYGNRLVDEALQLSRQIDLRAALGVAGARQRQAEQRRNARFVQEEHVRKHEE
jgi:hypothetical protein